MSIITLIFLLSEQKPFDQNGKSTTTFSQEHFYETLHTFKLI